MKIVVNTCNTHLHLIPVFCHLFNKYWSPEQEVTIIGYNHPNSFSESFNLPDNFKFVQLNGGDQQTVNDFSNHMYDYFSSLDDKYFIWMMEDTFLRNINFKILNAFYSVCQSDTTGKIGRIDLTEGMSHRRTSLWKTVDGVDILANDQDVQYRVAIQASIWNKEYLLKYLKPNLSPWGVELNALQPAIGDGWHILGTQKSFSSDFPESERRVDPSLAMTKNEGVAKNNIHKLNLNAMDEDTIREIQEIVNAY